jgi:hypothetical protein
MDSQESVTKKAKRRRWGSVRQVAERYDLSLPTVRARIASGEWPALYLGPRCTRIDIAAIERKARTAPPKDKPK